MDNQKGAALIVVLSLLTISLMVGLSSMQFSQIDERLAGNYKSAAEAQMGAEHAVSKGWADVIATPTVFGNADLLRSDMTDMSFDVFKDGAVDGECGSDVNCYYRVTSDNYIVGMGSVVNDGNILSVSEMVFAEVGLSSGGDSPFQDGLIGCEGVTVSQGGEVNSSVRTLSENSDITVSGGTHINGNVVATGGVYTDGSGSVGGDIRANGEVVINASNEYGGSIFSKGDVVLNNTARFLGGIDADGDVQFNNGARLAGDLKAGGDVTFANTDAYIEGAVTVAGDIYNNFDNWKDTNSFAGNGVATGPHSAVSSVGSSECDVLSLPSVFEDLEDLEDLEGPSNGHITHITVGGGPRVNATVTPQNITSFDQTWNVQEDVVLAESVNAPVFGFEGEVPIIRTGDLKLTNGEMRVTGGDVVLYVDGDLTLGSGGGPGLVIDPGSTLTIFVTGEANVKSSTQMSGVPQITNGRPTFSLFSSEEDVLSSQFSVTIDGSAKATANVYAPFANVSVSAGGGLNGSVRAKTIEVSGGGGIDYEKGLGDWKIGEGGGGATPSGILKWQ